MAHSSPEVPGHFYAGTAGSYTQSRPPYPPHMIDYVLQSSGLAAKHPSEVRIADIGAGAGQLSIPLAERGYEVVCVEPEPQMTQQLKARAPASVAGHIRIGGNEAGIGHAHDTGIAEGSVDLIVAGMGAHWFAASEHAGQTAAHWQRILKPGGKVALFYLVPDLQHPAVKAVDEELRAHPERYPHLAPAYMDPPFFVFNEWEKRLNRFAELFVDQRFAEKLGLGYAVSETVAHHSGAHSLDAIRDYFMSITPTRSVLESHPEEWNTLVAQVTKDPNYTDRPLEWECRVYLGEPRMRRLTVAERHPISRGMDIGRF